MNWLEIKTVAQRMLQRTDRDLDGLEPIVRAQMNKRLMVPENMTHAPLTTAVEAGDAHASAALPDDYERAYQVKFGRYKVDSAPLARLSMLTASGGRPMRYAIHGKRLYVAPGGGDIVLWYAHSLTPLAGDADENPVSEAYPMIYVAGLVYLAFLEGQAFDLSAEWRAEFGAQMEDANAKAEQWLRGDTPAMMQ